MVIRSTPHPLSIPRSRWARVRDTAEEFTIAVLVRFATLIGLLVAVVVARGAR